MLPSRGAQLRQLRARLKDTRVPRRLFSSNPNIDVYRSCRRQTPWTTCSAIQARSFSLVPSFISSRFTNSTQEASATIPPAQSPLNPSSTDTTSALTSSALVNPETSSSPAETPLVSSTSLDSLEFSSVGYASATEHVGYLKELGLNFGWGPTSVMQSLYEHVHVYSGLDWGVSIILTATLYRIFILGWPSLISSDQAARNVAMTPALLAAQKKMQAGEIDSQAYQMEFMKIRQTAGISFKKMFMPILIQAPLGFGTFRLLRSMAELPVPGLDQGGFLWLTDLTHSDPFYVLPIALAASMHIAAKRGYEGGATAANAMTPILVYVLPGIMGAFMVWMPATLQLSFFTTSLLGVLQGRLLQNSKVRNTLGLFPFYKNPQAQSSAPKTIDVPKVTRRERGSQVQSQSAMMGEYQAPAASEGKKSWLSLPKIPNVGEKFQNFQKEVTKQGNLMGIETKTKSARERAADRYDRTEPQREWRR